MLVSVVRPPGSSGATTTALALAAAWPSGPAAVVAECDPAGGWLAGAYGMPVEPGLAGLLGQTATITSGDLGRLAGAELPGGVRLLAAPLDHVEAQRIIDAAWHTLVVASVGAADVIVLADCGRVLPCSVPRPVTQSDVVVVVVRPSVATPPATVTAIARAQLLCRELVARDTPTFAVMVGAIGYEPQQVADALGVPVAGVLVDDAVDARLLAGAPASRSRANRSRLVRSARRVTSVLAAAAAGDLVGTVP